MWRIAKLALQPLTTQPYLWGVPGERLKHLAYQVCFESLCDSNRTCFPNNEHVVLSVCSASRFHVRCRILVQPQMLVSSGSSKDPVLWRTGSSLCPYPPHHACLSLYRIEVIFLKGPVTVPVGVTTSDGDVDTLKLNT